ncbi:DUF4279 domain-containing protein [Hahella sp. CR1]|uniref:DUF4279 domain-containing protein n=1 Tax=Hahella sp. CR1 TaxID=2992807 RepID=UPI00244206E0|nr:DUF4279 domain-containing protein [Hahella sp. CR1]MDG9670150.1 DUF4279 domain-containing protein [Hahella sp. CR1]
MAHLSRSVVSFRVFGDDLIPEEITNILGCEPTHGQTKGDVIIAKKTGHKRTASTGLWRIRAISREPGNIDDQVREIFDQLTSDPDVWKVLSERYSMDLFCGLFMDVDNEGLLISPHTLRLLGSRGISLDFDIYGPD